MPLIQSGIFSIVERFPDLRPKAIRLYKESEAFQTVCEDYLKCREALRHWNRSTSKEAPSMKEEYKALLRDLENEILLNLSESK